MQETNLNTSPPTAGKPLLPKWDVVVVLVASVAAIITPLRLVLVLRRGPILFYFDEILTVIFALDIIVRWQRCRREAGWDEHQQGVKGILTRYSAVWLGLDLVAAMPWG